MKKEDCGDSDVYSLDPSTPSAAAAEKPAKKTRSGRRGRESETPKTPRTAKRPRKSVNNPPEAEALPLDDTTATPKSGRKKRGSQKSKTPNSAGSSRSRGASSSNALPKPVTKAGLAGAADKEAYSYSDLFLGDDQEDENVDAGDDDSEYAPSDEEVARSVAVTAGRRKGASAGTRRQSKNRVDESEEAGGSTDEDEAGESESELDDDDEDEGDGEGEPGQIEENDAPVALFEDDANQAPRDVYDFDNQSILSDKRVVAARKRTSTSRSAGVATHRTAPDRNSRRVPAGPAASWGSNIYSALAASLKNRADLDAYSNFLKSPVLNEPFDHFLAELCKPSNQHASLFYGASASLQSLMSRVNDYDKVVELLHAFVSHPYDQLQHRVVYLAPVIHQPLFGLSHISPVNNALSSLIETIDKDMVIKPIYVLDQDTNLLAMRNSAISEFGIPITQYNLITGSGNVSRYMPDIRQLVVPSELFEKFTDLICLPPERVYEVALARAHRQQDEADIDISPLEPPNLQRIMLAIDAEGVLLAVIILDSWNRGDVPRNRPQPPVDLVDIAQQDKSGSFKSPSLRESNRMSVEEQVKEVLDGIIDWVVLKSDVTDAGNISKRANRSDESCLGEIYFMDAFLMKPNGRHDTLILVAHCSTSHPPLKDSLPDSENFRIYCIIDENRFMLERHGFTPDLPIALDGVHSVDPEELLEDKSLLVVPDLLFDTLRKVMLRELISSTGSITSAATTAINAKQPDIKNPLLPLIPVIQCTKFIILDRLRHIPLAVAFDSPVRLTLQVGMDKLGLHPFGEDVRKQFDQLTPTELKTIESNFKPTTAEYRLVAINGLLVGLQMDDQRVVRRAVEIVPSRFSSVFPHTNHPAICAQSAVASFQSCPSSVRIVNDETDSSTVLPAYFYPYYERQKLSSVISGFADHLCTFLFDLPIEISLYDIMFRMAQKYMPELLTRQHIEAAEAAAYAEAAANPEAPPPAPAPLPDHWSVCCVCSKELRSINGLLDHEMRHIGLSRFRCAIHNICFLDRRSWLAHMDAYHSTSRSTALSSTLPPVTNTAQADSGSEEEYEAEDAGQGDTSGRGLLAGLAQVFNTGVLVGRMEAPQCEKCGDYFLTADLLAHHLDYCDGVSFCVRTPIPRTQKSTNAEDHVNDQADSTAEATDLVISDEQDEPNNNSCICGMCGFQLTSRERILRHFTNYHLLCILCNKVLRSLEELSYHYQVHLQNDATVPIKPEQVNEGEENDAEANSDGTQPSACKSLLGKLMKCDICSNFCGTKYNYYFHQWAEHGVVHPPLGSTDGVPQVVQQTRQLRPRPDRDDLYYSVTGVRRMKCKFCGLVVRVTGKEYIEHLSEKHEVFANPDVICRICADLFTTPELLSGHLADNHVPTGEYTNAGVQTIYRCPHCEFWGFSKGVLKHAREIHNDFTPAMYECGHCYERFSDKRCWRAHLDKHTEGYSHRCVECGRAFRLRTSLLHHMRTYHGEDQGPATCEYCGLTYPKQSSLRYHVFRMHNQELANECFMCQRRFRLETELRRHIKEMHSGAVRCEICHKVCNNLRCYSQHRQKHFRTRIYQCTDCHTTFKSKLAMKRHIRVEHLQLGPEKFECQICGKIVTQIGMHMLIHKEARFECEYCGKRFTKAAYYNEHLRIHRGEQPFECHICKKRFNKKSNLNVHLRFHEKHRDEEGNYLELKPRGRISTMFGDALMSPAERAARQAAIRAGNHGPFVPKVDACVGSDLPGAFNCGGPANAASEAAQRAIEAYRTDMDELNHIDGIRNHRSDSSERRRSERIDIMTS
ncbi:unnamed protein product [Calicophoron daubneyi]|uniref:C2H2-type domain-containing protein n=1 Tax=Calicophoron daubneyi TaxID=300641 RepID=A0AAV2TBR3_CALDB